MKIVNNFNHKFQKATVTSETSLFNLTGDPELQIYSVDCNLIDTLFKHLP